MIDTFEDLVEYYRGSYKNTCKYGLNRNKIIKFLDCCY